MALGRTGSAGAQHPSPSSSKKKKSKAEPSAFLRRACVLNHTALETMWGNSRKMASPGKIMKMTVHKVFINLALGMSITSSHNVWYCSVLHTHGTNHSCPKRAASAKLCLLWRRLVQHMDIKVCKTFHVSVLHRWNLRKLAGTNTGHFNKSYVWCSTTVLYSQGLNVLLVHDGN